MEGQGQGSVSNYRIRARYHTHLPFPVVRGINRIGNLLVPNLSYVAFEDWFMPVLDRMHDEQVG